jgi:transposase
MRPLLVIVDNVVLLFLPPYSPELNPIERLWQDIKEGTWYGDIYQVRGV